jgi:hypothetical protein
MYNQLSLPWLCEAGIAPLGELRGFFKRKIRHVPWWQAYYTLYNQIKFYQEIL